MSYSVFQKPSGVQNSAAASSVGFSPNLMRDPVSFLGIIQDNILFREAISALHAVVMDDQINTKEKKRATARIEKYKEWRKEQDSLELDQIIKELQTQKTALIEELQARQVEIQATIQESGSAEALLEKENKQKELQEQINKLQSQITFLDRQDIIDCAYQFGFQQARNTHRQKQYREWLKYDPVITVHPDELFFECFSLDESSYGKLSLDYSSFSLIDKKTCGTTNVDYSQDLYDEFQKIRSYKRTELAVNPDGFTVKTDGEDDYKENKIDLPPSWVQGFVQMSAAMTLPTTTVRLHPMDIRMICELLRRYKAKQGPRSLRISLRPNEPVSIEFEPWGEHRRCHRSIYKGEQPKTIRIWGRRRFLILERLIPIANHFDLHLLGKGLPYFFTVPLSLEPSFDSDTAKMCFTLGLSGWSSNNFTATSNFSFLETADIISDDERETLYQTLRHTCDWTASISELETKLGYSRAQVMAALLQNSRMGRVVYDPHKKLFRARELFAAPLSLENATKNPKEVLAEDLVEQNQLQGFQKRISSEIRLKGYIFKDENLYRPQLTMDLDENILEAQSHCNCPFFYDNRMMLGPCEHLIALKLIHDAAEQHEGENNV